MKTLDIANVSRIDSLRSTCRITRLSSSQSSNQEITVGFSHIQGECSLPPNDTNLRALVDYSQDPPLIISFMPLDAGAVKTKNLGMSSKTAHVTKHHFESFFGSMDSYNSFMDHETNFHFRGNRPYDLIPGDILFQNPYDKNGLLIGMGGINVLKVSDTNQIIQTLLDNLTRILGRNIQIISDFGVIKLDNTDGKVKFDLKGSRLHDDVKKAKYDLSIEMGACKDGNMVSVKYNREKDNDPYVFTIDRNGQEFKSIPDNHTLLIKENSIGSIGKNKTQYVGKEYFIEVGETYILDAPAKPGSIKLGSENLTSEQNALVRYPFLVKYHTLLNKLLLATTQPMALPFPGIPLILQNPGFAELLTELISEIAIVKEDKTTKVWGE